MVRGYTTLYSRTPRSFLFAVVANVGPGGASRPLAVAYRQGCDRTTALWPPERIHRFVADTLALIEILSDPANRALLEAERALAKDWYRRSKGANEPHINERPSVPDSPQPPFVKPDRRYKYPVPPRPQLPWHDDALSEFPFTATCLVLGLLRGDGDATNSNSARPGDVQLQPLSTVFRGDCTEYGLVVLDISDLDSGVKYGIVAFRMHYMAEVWARFTPMNWDPIEDKPPLKEPDVVLDSPRPRVPLSIHQWLSKYRVSDSVKKDPSVLRLEDRPLVDAAALDYLWPPELEDQDTDESQAEESSQGLLSSSSDYFWPIKPTTRAEGASTTTTAPSQEPLRNAHIDHAIDDMLLHTQEPAEPPLEKTIIGNLQKLVEYREQLRQRLEEVPDSLGPSDNSGYILRVAYAGRRHLNWVAFRNLAPSVIAAAVASDELRGASALSLCVDQFKLRGDEGEEDLGDLAAALARSTALKQLCFLQRPDRDSDNASARFCSQLLLLWKRISGGGLGSITIYPTSAFSTSLRSRKYLTSSSTITSPVFPVIHIFTFVGRQREDVLDADTDADQQYENSSTYSYSGYYAMDNTLLDAERFAGRFLAYLQSLGSGSGFEKAILRFAYKGPSSSLTTTTSPGQFGVSPIPVGYFDHELPPNDPSNVRRRDIHSGSWVVLVAAPEQNSDHSQAVAERPRPRPPPPPPPPPPRPKCHAGLTPTDPSNVRQPSANMDRRGRSCGSSDVENGSLQYSFVRIIQTSTETASEQQQPQQQRQVPVPDLAEVIGGLTNFLRETVPGSDISTWEEQVEEVERDLRTQQTSIGTGKRCIDMRVMAEGSAHTLLKRLL